MDLSFFLFFVFLAVLILYMHVTILIVEIFAIKRTCPHLQRGRGRQRLSDFGVFISHCINFFDSIANVEITLLKLQSLNLTPKLGQVYTALLSC